MCEMANHGLRLWVHKLVRFAHQGRPEVVPRPPGTVFDTPPVLKLIADVTHGRRSCVDGTNKRKASATGHRRFGEEELQGPPAACLYGTVQVA